jgi:hypothetical protein
MPDNNFGHTREDCFDLLGDAFDEFHCNPDEIYVAIQRVANVQEQKMRKDLEQVKLAEQPHETEGAA